ncbi:hypothetical protein EHS13_02445 [Paenibacillus psychroresistens]|uniref:DUF5666 domain-containing protein n=1 Tax=Paenibacillus psychroresistens TaxID=1778678 RepID=A0A6B8RE79_9BACL|nr:hypothetical protein [Paenibacillus psychroresistens]QGQ93845.1 hypothetical protein EHS13_02445 [Paenibacillus psychroresistens]
MKKVKLLFITCLTIALLSFGVVAFANGGTSTDSVNISHKIVTGKFIALEEENTKVKVSLEAGTELYPLDKTILVLRDKEKAVLANLKVGDKLEFAFNSSNKVAFIKAYSEAFLKAEAAALLATPAPTLAPTATVKPTPSPTDAPKVVKPIHKVKAVDPAIAALKDDKDKKDCDGKFDGKNDGKDNKNSKNHANKENDHRQDKDNKHHGRDIHEMKKNG